MAFLHCQMWIDIVTSITVKAQIPDFERSGQHICQHLYEWVGVRPTTLIVGDFMQLLNVTYGFQFLFLKDKIENKFPFGLSILIMPVVASASFSFIVISVTTKHFICI